jgi:hypothetical protein
MQRYRIHLVALGIVAVWAVFSYAYLGMEDGSSGLSPLGWISAVFFIPGGSLMQSLKGSHSNADLPLMAGAGWLLFSMLALAIAQGVSLIRKPAQKEKVPLP